MTNKTVVYTYGTGNPVDPNGSGDVRDGIDNLKSFDVFMNAEEDTYNQRDGDIVQTVSGAIRSLGIPIIGNFTDGCTVTQSSQGVQVIDGSVYRWSGSLPKVVPPSSSPETTGGISPTGYWVDIGDASVRGDLAKPLGASMVGLMNGGTGAVSRTVQDKMRDFVSVKDFGAVGDNIVDDTAAIQNGINYAMQLGAVLYFPAGHYKVTDTLSLTNINFLRSGGLQGENGNSTRIYFNNTTVLKNLFTIDTDVNYVTFSDIEFIDVNPRTSRGFYFSDTIASGSPTWKHLFRNVRITGFKEGARFDGDASIPANDAHCSEVMFLHSKTRNCETGLVYNNTQAVNHQLIGMDMENDAEGASDEWTHIKLERGTTVNHFGGSVIGKGSYLKYKYAVASGFQDTCQFVSRGVRVEKRGGASPLINHDVTSDIVPSNSIRIIIKDMPIVAFGGATLFARFGGRTFAKLSNVHANVQMDVEAYMTTNLSANGLYGSVDIEDCQAINYKRVSTVAAYGGAGVSAANLRSIPSKISHKNEGEQTTTDGSGYIQVSKPEQTVYSGGWQTAQVKTLVYANPDNGGLGSGSNTATVQIGLPLHGRPCKFRLLRDDVNASSNFVLDLYAVVAGVDYLVASIAPTANAGGHFEANIQTATGLTFFINDGSNWDGKMKVVKSGTVNGFVGLIMVDYM